jgi:putative transposase
LYVKDTNCQITNKHKVLRLKIHIVWVTKYRYGVLHGDIKMRYKTILIQIYEGEGVQILKRIVSKDHVQMYIEYRPSQYVSTLVKLLKELSLRKLKIEFLDLKKRYWRPHFWTIGFSCLEYV